MGLPKLASNSEMGHSLRSKDSTVEPSGAPSSPVDLDGDLKPPTLEDLTSTNVQAASSDSVGLGGAQAPVIPQ